MKIYPEDTDLSVFASDQISVWPLAKDNYRALKSVRTRTVKVGGLDAVLQYNPARIVSSSAKIDRESLSARECFLCRGHRGDQSYIPFHGKKGREYDVLLNPYPIFPRHFTVPLSVHTEQSIWRRYPDMLGTWRSPWACGFLRNGGTFPCGFADQWGFRAQIHFGKGHGQTFLPPD